MQVFSLQQYRLRVVVWCLNSSEMKIKKENLISKYYCINLIGLRPSLTTMIQRLKLKQGAMLIFMIVLMAGR